MKLKNKKLFTLLFLFVVFSSLSVFSARAVDDDLSIDFYITDAYYTDADKDDYEDDVIGEYKLYLDYDDDDYEFKFYILEIKLVLPSGYMYKHTLMKTEEPHGNQRIYLINHATEAGWYDLYIKCSVFFDCGKNPLLVMRQADDITFDPPGGGGGGPPVCY